MMPPPPPPSRRVAIVGGGIAGIACSWELRKHDCSVDIFEADDKLGGHANSVSFKGKRGSVSVDTGFIAIDEATYPHFNAFLGELGVETMPTDMSFGVSTSDGAFEWSSYSLWSFVGTLTRLLSPWFWRLMFDVVRFSLFAQDAVREEPCVAEPSQRRGSDADAVEDDLGAAPLESIGEYLRRQGYSEQFMAYFLIPMVAAPWCIDPDEFAATFPARPLIQFMLRHGLLDTVTQRLQWRTFRHGSRTYVDAFQRRLPPRHRLHLNTPVQRVTRVGDETVVSLHDGPSRTYDDVVLAVHANQALALMGGDATALERRILGSFKTSKNVCHLHSDTSHLPRRPSARAAWNCFVESEAWTPQNALAGKPRSRKISITFDMNKLQAIPFPGQAGSPGRVLVSMNPTRTPRALQSSHIYHHPLLSSESILMTRHLDKINGVSGLAFAGAWMGYGFHEDGFVAGVHAARLITHGRDKTRPLDLMQDGMDNLLPKGGTTRILLRLGVGLVQWLLRLRESMVDAWAWADVTSQEKSKLLLL
ncbi:flavin containing amine oxidoreductase [Hirsutella rhossiliensis]|uniref:Flavin containing amine oxidoreductase domain-containing protein n=1 Tax=Hirsutella rhossiliensis TaxID=111463 RepID=A0A9P8SJH2_9HYPO|nr:flavin containing amine oxidoreductase domain-containing protein [Hirsutella rhossiliensis]KAH0964204.1 flavin containing amine oxidoreductase domain-containing protein [Hirsutella rhossiliensis]